MPDSEPEETIPVPVPALTKVSFNAIPRALTALNFAADQAGLTRTDTANRALQIYATLMNVSWWRAIPILFRERAQLRVFAADPDRFIRSDPSGGDPR